MGKLDTLSSFPREEMLPPERTEAIDRPRDVSGLISDLRSSLEQVPAMGRGPAERSPADGRAAEPSLLMLEPGRAVGLVGPPGLGLTGLGLSMLAAPAGLGTVAYLDVRGWLCPPAAWEAGIAPERLVVVRCDDPVRWARVAATLLEGLPAVYAEVPRGVRDPQLRKLGALARSNGTSLILRPVRGGLPSGLAHLRLTAREIQWEGVDAGHGRLTNRRLVLEAAGKAMRGMSGIIEVEEDGANALHLVSRLAAAPAGRVAG